MFKSKLFKWVIPKVREKYYPGNIKMKIFYTRLKSKTNKWVTKQAYKDQEFKNKRGSGYNPKNKVMVKRSSVYNH